MKFIVKKFILFLLVGIGLSCSNRDTDRGNTSAYVHQLRIDGKDYWSIDLYTDNGPVMLVAPCNNGSVSLTSIIMPSIGSVVTGDQERPLDGKYTGGLWIMWGQKRTVKSGYVLICNNGSEADINLAVIDYDGKDADIPNGKYAFQSSK